jgi:hypothetical protein
MHTIAHIVCGPGSHTFTDWCTGPGWWQSLGSHLRHAWLIWEQEIRVWIMLHPNG